MDPQEGPSISEQYFDLVYMIKASVMKELN